MWLGQVGMGLGLIYVVGRRAQRVPKARARVGRNPTVVVAQQRKIPTGRLDQDSGGLPREITNNLTMEEEL